MYPSGASLSSHTNNAFAALNTAHVLRPQLYTVLLSLLVPLCVNNTTVLTLMYKTKPDKIQEYKMMYIPVCIKVFNLQVSLHNFLLFLLYGGLKKVINIWCFGPKLS